MQHYNTLILGAGFSGLGMGIQLKKSGNKDFLILERSSEVGGTWRDNTYPGAACDVPSHLYSYSFAMNPNWNKLYAPQPEILSYILSCTETYGLRPFIRFGSDVVSCKFDDLAGLWTVKTDDGSLFRAQFVISALGPLANPSTPDIKGLATFAGPKMHSARWDHCVDLKDRDIVVIGSGASAIQIVPEIASVAKSVTIFQRTPPWIMPKPDHYIPEWAKRIYRKSPFILRLRRFLLFVLTELYGPIVYLKTAFFKTMAETVVKAYIRRSIADPKLRQAVTPQYRIGCKRVLISHNWYATLQRKHVTLVSESPAAIKPTGVCDGSGNEYPADVIILATGFIPPTSGAPFEILGLGGRSLGDVWENGAFAYKGLSITGFPNLFFLLGPNTGPGHTSILLYLEAQVGYVIQAIKRLQQGSYRYMNLREAPLRDWNQWLTKRMQHMVWTSGGCHSWYLTAEGKNTSLYPGPVSEYVAKVSRFNSSDYDWNI